MNLLSHRSRLPKVAMFVAGFLALGVVFIKVPHVSAQTCAVPTPPTTYGQVKQSVSVTTAGTYRVWSRIKAPNTASNSYYLQIDGGCPINVGDATSIAANTWTWVNYQNGSTASVINATLTAGTHQLTYTGKEADVQLDRVLFLGDLNCSPTGTGDDCANPTANDPTVTISAPANNASVTKGTAVNITTNVTNTVKVDFLVDGTVVNTDTATPFSYSWATTNATVGAHSITARAYNASNATVSSAPVTVNVTALNNTDTVPPTVSLSASTATVNVNGSVTLTATAGDNVGVTKVEFVADGTVIDTKTQASASASWSPTFTWAPSTAGIKSLVARAYDAAGNQTTSSPPVTLTVSGSNPNGLGDVNGDGHVNGDDYAMLVGHLGQDYAAADFDNDGSVTGADLAILLGHWTW